MSEHPPHLHKLLVSVPQAERSLLWSYKGNAEPVYLTHPLRVVLVLSSDRLNISNHRF
jgi:hypothetical protein